MSVLGEWKAATISAGAGRSSAIDLGREYDYLLVQLPGMDACKLSLQVSEFLAGTYYDLGKDVTTDEENFGRSDVWLLGGFRYIKVVSSKRHKSDVAIRVQGKRT